jgi:hypothetical protein
MVRSSVGKFEMLSSKALVLINEKSFVPVVLSLTL